ncbi:hypothetical protein F5Y18DRAFT_386898 [Xylariaceae sp. FL1019]|nr:hypothetical protein F5Y18DRAFT_386898 [Xylariaceae sp. FL1019]
MAVGRFWRSGGGCWALWIAGLWLELALSNGRYLPCSRYLALPGISFLLESVSLTSPGMVKRTGILGNNRGENQKVIRREGPCLERYVAA